MKSQHDAAIQTLDQWFQTQQMQRTRDALEKNGFETYVHPDSRSAVGALLHMISDGSTVGIGGSMTLTQMGFFTAVSQRRITVVNPLDPGVNEDERRELSRKTFSCDYFLSSANAVTEDGHLYNVDATGNRVAAMCFGPGVSIVVCGINKIVRNMVEARQRVISYAGPANAKRLGRKTPCAVTGVCADCDSPDRICNIQVELLKKPARSRIVVLLVGEVLGL